MSVLTAITTLVLVWYAFNTPFTKVEESFNMQAIHDLIYSVPDFDHLQFPGVVPRTFLGPICISTVLGFFRDNFDKYTMLVVVRILMALITGSALNFLSNAIDKKYGNNVKVLFERITASQFHLMYWGSRTLPNTWGLILFTYSIAFLLREEYMLMISTVVSAALVFRCELAPLAIFMTIIPVMIRKLKFPKAIFIALASGMAAVYTSILIDSEFWGYSVWPEYRVFQFNGLQDGSAAWGVSPWYEYLVHFLPKIAPVGFPLLVIGTFMQFRSISVYVLMVFIHVFVMSFIGHKEWRFVIYLVPVINLGAAIFTNKLLESKKGFKRAILNNLLYAAIIASSVASAILYNVSVFNYPGGAALAQFANMDIPAPCSVHYDTYTAQTGASRFLENHPNCRYSKVENHKYPQDFVDAGYTHIITEDPEFHEQSYQVVYEFNGYSGYEIIDPFKIWNDIQSGILPELPIKIQKTPLVFIMEKKK